MQTLHCFLLFQTICAILSFLPIGARDQHEQKVPDMLCLLWLHWKGLPGGVGGGIRRVFILDLSEISLWNFEMGVVCRSMEAWDRGVGNSLYHRFYCNRDLDIREYCNMSITYQIQQSN